MIVLDDPYILPAPQHPNPERDITVISPDAIPEYVSELKAMDSSPSADERGGLRVVSEWSSRTEDLGSDSDVTSVDEDSPRNRVHPFSSENDTSELDDDHHNLHVNQTFFHSRVQAKLLTMPALVLDDNNAESECEDIVFL